LLVLLIVERQFGLFSEVVHLRLRIGMPLWPLIISLFIAFIGTFGSSLVYSRYTKVYRLTAEGLETKSPLGSLILPWNSITQPDRIVEASRGPNGERIDLKGIRLVGGGSQVVIHDDLGGFDSLKSSVAAQVKQRGVPVSEKDAGWSTMQVWKDSIRQQVPGGEGWQKVFVQRPIAEL
jgi:hypothetical protein